MLEFKKVSDFMKLLSNEEIQKNNVDTINQYKVLQYLKSNLNIMSFKVYLYDVDTIKVIDVNEDIGYFKFDNDKKQVKFIEELENNYEISL